MSTKELSGDKDWSTIYTILVNELELVTDRAKSDPEYTQDIEPLARIIHELHDQGVSLMGHKATCQTVIDMITRQAVNIYSRGSKELWNEMDITPPFGEDWFWETFVDIVDESVMALNGAVEAWVTVEYEETIADILER